MRNRWLLLCEKHYLKEPARYESILSSMASVQRHRGPDDEGIWLWEHAGFPTPACPSSIWRAADSR